MCTLQNAKIAFFREADKDLLLFLFVALLPGGCQRVDSRFGSFVIERVWDCIAGMESVLIEGSKGESFSSLKCSLLRVIFTLTNGFGWVQIKGGMIPSEHPL